MIALSNPHGYLHAAPDQDAEEHPMDGRKDAWNSVLDQNLLAAGDHAAGASSSNVRRAPRSFRFKSG